MYEKGLVGNGGEIVPRAEACDLHVGDLGLIPQRVSGSPQH